MMMMTMMMMIIIITIIPACMGRSTPHSVNRDFNLLARHHTLLHA